MNQYGTKIYYDDNSRIQMVFHYLDYSCPADNYHGTTYGHSSDYFFTYDKENGNISQMRISGDAITGTVTPKYDNFGRLDYRITTFKVNSGSDFYNYNRTNAFYEKLDYQYTEKYGHQTGQVEKVTQEIRQGADSAILSSKEYNFSYDQNGNITEIADQNSVIQYKYYYDNLGQLIREDNRALGYSYTYSYDNAGNIISKKRYAFTTGTLTGSSRSTVWIYGNSTWGDLLTEYNGYTVEYDEIGNPTKIGYCDSDYWYEHYELIWQGRQLMSYVYSEEGGENVQFAYNADGIRTQKIVDGVVHHYILSGSRIIAETWTQSGIEYLMYYLYDENGAPIGLQYRTSDYASQVFDSFFFEKNVFGDIIGVYNSSGKKLCTYTYDAWGVCYLDGISGVTLTAVEDYVAEHNPFRYRGYYYDVETGLYYLQSRYYNPEWGRFINADGYVSTGTGMLGYNMFAYCNNNPVMFVDPTGEAWWHWALAAAVVVACAAATVLWLLIVINLLLT